MEKKEYWLTIRGLDRPFLILATVEEFSERGLLQFTRLYKDGTEQDIFVQDTDIHLIQQNVPYEQRQEREDE